MTKPGIDADGIAETESDHFIEVPGLLAVGSVDMRELAQVVEHIHDGEIGRANPSTLGERPMH
jgi:hypothetical protein